MFLSSGGIPCPWSRISKVEVCLFMFPTAISIGVFSGVYLIALVIRFTKTCCSFPSSAYTGAYWGVFLLIEVSFILRLVWAFVSRIVSFAIVARSMWVSSSGFFSSSLVRFRRSSTSLPMRMASCSILCMASVVWVLLVSAPWRYSSAKPRIVTRGVRSSWLASLMKRRILFSELVRILKAFSMWFSMAFSELLSLPSSVFEFFTSSLCVRSPAAMEAAVDFIFFRGLKVLFTARYATIVAASVVRQPIIVKSIFRLCRVCVMWFIGSATMKMYFGFS